MKIPRHDAQTCSPEERDASTSAIFSVDLTTRATRDTGDAVGVGRRSFTEYSAVTVDGTRRRRVFFIKCHAAVQLEWQSRSAPMIPPLNVPGHASCSREGIHSARTSSPWTKLRILSPFRFASPQPKQTPREAYCS